MHRKMVNILTTKVKITKMTVYYLQLPKNSRFDTIQVNIKRNYELMFLYIYQCKQTNNEEI